MPAIVVVIFIAVFGLVLGRVLAVRPARRINPRTRRSKSACSPIGSPRSRRKPGFSSRSNSSAASRSSTPCSVGQGRFTDPLQRDLTQAGLQMTVGTLLLSSGCLALLAYVIVRFITNITLIGLAAGVLAAFIPFIYVKQKKNNRLRKFEEQFPEAIDLIGRALRAGHAFTTGSGDGGRGDSRSRWARSSSCSTTGRISACRCRTR